jgi:hypothetical protein
VVGLAADSTADSAGMSGFIYLALPADILHGTTSARRKAARIEFPVIFRL